MNYIGMLNTFEWGFKSGKTELDKLDRILAGLRRTLLDDEPEKELDEFWEYISKFNVYMCALLLKRAEKVYGATDFCVSRGYMIINSNLKKFSLDGDYIWRMFAEIEMRTAYYLREYVRYAVDSGTFKKKFHHLQHSNYLSGSVIFLLSQLNTNDVQRKREILSVIISQKWQLEIALPDDKALISGVIDVCIETNDVPSLTNILELFYDLKLSEFSPKSLVDWKEYSLAQPQPVGMIFFYEFLKRENVAADEIINELYDFTTWVTGDENYYINNFIYFARAIKFFPENFDSYAIHFKDETAGITTETGKNMTTEEIINLKNQSWSDSSKRSYNYLMVDKPFKSLLMNKPDKIMDFLKIVSPINLYDSSKSKVYSKSSTWAYANGAWLNKYRQFLIDASKKVGAEEVLYIYMNSPMKSIVDISFVIRMLFMPEIGYVDLTDIFANYTFRGKLSKFTDDKNNITYRVLPSNVCSTYQFPVHQSWADANSNSLENEMLQNEVVFYKIMSVNSKGMIFVYDLTMKNKTENNIYKHKYNGEVVKFISQIKNGTLQLSGINVEQKVRLHSMAMVFDDKNKILTETINNDGELIECIPSLMVSNNETYDATIKRVLKYFLGFFGEISVSPCGIRHLCVGRENRDVFVIFKIMLSDCQAQQSNLICKNTTHWRDFEEYKSNLKDKISLSFISAPDYSWSEERLILN